jgi:hypothetical protein
MRTVSFALIITLVLTACTFPGDDRGMAPPPCECPNLERIVESIEWTPGIRGRQTSNSASDDQTRRSVTYEFAVNYVVKSVDRLRDLLDTANIKVEEDAAVGGFRASRPPGAIVIMSLDGKLLVNVGLIDRANDGDAEQVLQPFTEAIGFKGDR